MNISNAIDSLMNMGYEYEMAIDAY